MSTQIELLIALLSLLAGVLYAWIAVQGWRPWRLLPSCGQARRTGPGIDREFRDTSPGVTLRATEEQARRTAQ